LCPEPVHPGYADGVDTHCDPNLRCVPDAGPDGESDITGESDRAIAALGSARL
jgi:hypothetical protein